MSFGPRGVIPAFGGYDVKTTQVALSRLGTQPDNDGPEVLAGRARKRTYDGRQREARRCF
jgi:hypothetical protein